MERKEYTLRPYQQECVDILDKVESGNVLVALATGMGKSMIFTHIKRTGRVLILSHRDELVRQPEKYYAEDVTCGIEKGDEYSAQMTSIRLFVMKHTICAQTTNRT